MSESLHDRVVAAIGHQYELESEIGRGGTSIVYRARDLRLNRAVAIKVLPPELAHDAAIRTRFTREAQTSAQLSHPHIVPIYDVGERDGIAYFVMSIVTGGNLARLLTSEPRQPIDEVRRILCEIADALAYAHLRGVIHRDIKPDNILLDRDSGRAMVTDFGIAWAMEAASRLTVTGIAVGTPAYMSPEQAVGERELDGRSDIYSLGVLGYQMLTGRVPFTAGNSMALLLKHVTERPRAITDLRPDTPPAMDDAIDRALLKAPEDRWPTATAFRDALATDAVPGASWRPERRESARREPARHTSLPSEGARRARPARERSLSDPPSVSPRRGTPSVEQHSGLPAPLQGEKANALEMSHLASLTPAQRDDLRLWHGRVSLLDRIKAMRGYTLLTAATMVAAFTGFAVGVDDSDAFPLLFAPIVPFFMTVKLWRRGRSLQESGLKLRRVFLAFRASRVLPAPPPVPHAQQLEQHVETLTSREILDSPEGAAIRRAAEDRAVILDIAANLSKADRALLPDLEPTVNGLVERVAHLAQMLHRLDEDIEPRLIADLDARIAGMESVSESPERERRLGLLQRQRATLEELVGRRAVLAHQLESAGLALGNLRLDLIKLRSSGLQSALSDVSTATQEARALSREIGVLLHAADEVRSLS